MRKLEVFHVLSVPVVVETLENILVSLLKDEEVDIECSKCESSKSISQTKIVKWPEKLIIHFKRYELVLGENNCLFAKRNDRQVILSKNLIVQQSIKRGSKLSFKQMPQICPLTKALAAHS